MGAFAPIADSKHKRSYRIAEVTPQEMGARSDYVKADTVTTAAKNTAEKSKKTIKTNFFRKNL